MQSRETSDQTTSVSNYYDRFSCHMTECHVCPERTNFCDAFYCSYKTTQGIVSLLTKQMFSFLFPHFRLKKSIIKITHRSLCQARLRWKSRLDGLSFIGFPRGIKHSNLDIFQIYFDFT